MQTNNINFIQQWHLTTGCTKISDGCRNCSVEQKMRSHLPGKSFFDVNCYPERLDELCRKRKAATYFVCSMGDLFHSEVPDRFIYEAWRYMAACKKHTFIVITKRPERAMGLLAKCKGWKGLITHNGAPEEYVYAGGGIFVGHEDNWPPKNIWLGVSIENQARADECIRYLLRTPAAVRFLDIEPMLRFIDVRQASWGKGYLRPPVDIQARQTEAPLGAIDWIVCGGETGAKSRPAHPDWVRSLRDQCVNAAVPFYFMGWGDWVHENQIAENMMPKALNSKKMDAHDGCQFVKIGKKHSGRLLDGREWNEMPKVCVEGGQP